MIIVCIVFRNNLQVLDVSGMLPSLHSLFGPHWDIYVISVLVGVIVLILVWRRNNL